MPKSIKKSGEASLPFTAYSSARAELIANYPKQDVLFGRIVEAIDTDRLKEAAYVTLVNGVKKAAKSLGREIIKDKWGDEVILAPKENA